MKVTVTRSDSVSYPEVGDIAPTAPDPEYPFPDRSKPGEGSVYDLVRRCLLESGADREAYGTPSWNPLGAWIRPGQRVFILPNFVTHRRPDESPEAFQAKCTHASVIRPMVDYAVIAAGDPSLVSFGNAPIQAADYERVARETGAEAIREHYLTHTGVDVGPRDLRLLVTRWNRWGALLEKEVRNPEDAVEVDLGSASLLEDLYRDDAPTPRFRVGDYPPDETESYHGKGRHIYVVNRQVLDAEVIISVPKLKTHQKVGITCALKGTVGSIARKECLAHHQKGPVRAGGDEYPRAGLLRWAASDLADRVTTLGHGPLSNALRVFSLMVTRSTRLGPRGISRGGWYGNDTAWRMALDIARILRHARSDGSLSDRPIRPHLALVDGVVGGQGEGPLRPQPARKGVVLFGADACGVDATCAIVMGLAPQDIPLVFRSFKLDTLPLTDHRLDDLQISWNGETVEAKEVAAGFRPPFVLPRGWRESFQGRAEDK